MSGINLPEVSVVVSTDYKSIQKAFSVFQGLVCSGVGAVVCGGEIIFEIYSPKTKRELIEINLLARFLAEEKSWFSGEIEMNTIDVYVLYVRGSSLSPKSKIHRFKMMPGAVVRMEKLE